MTVDLINRQHRQNQSTLRKYCSEFGNMKVILCYKLLNPIIVERVIVQS